MGVGQSKDLFYGAPVFQEPPSEETLGRSDLKIEKIFNARVIFVTPLYGTYTYMGFTSCERALQITVALKIFLVSW